MGDRLDRGAGRGHRATKLLLSIPGIGVWTVAEVVRLAYGDPDAVTVGDYHLPNHVVYALTGAARAGARDASPGRISSADARMLEVLEPFRPQRARVVQMLLATGRQCAEVRPALAGPVVRPLLSRRVGSASWLRAALRLTRRAAERPAGSRRPSDGSDARRRRTVHAVYASSSGVRRIAEHAAGRRRASCPNRAHRCAGTCTAWMPTLIR